jgi:hypothetical protein
MKTRNIFQILALILFIIGVFSSCKQNESAVNKKEITEKVIAMEKIALDRWGNGDPSGFLEIYADEISYFSPGHPLRIDGLSALSKLFSPLKGKIFIERAQMINPRFQIYDNTAILTYNLINFVKEENKIDTTYWNSTAVYENIKDEWKIIHSHWSHPKNKIINQDANSISDI